MSKRKPRKELNKVWNDSFKTEPTIDVDKAINETFERCIKICEGAASSWSIKDPTKMALHCAKLIRNEYQKKGITPRFSREFINELKVRGLLRV